LLVHSRKNVMKKSKQTPKCEICGKAPAEFFWSGENPEREHNDWKFTCVNCCSDFYAFEINNFFESPREEVNWIWHLRDKTWMDVGNFMQMLDRWVAGGGQRLSKIDELCQGIKK
jgi:hypothetical protein